MSRPSDEVGPPDVSARRGVPEPPSYASIPPRSPIPVLFARCVAQSRTVLSLTRPAQPSPAVPGPRPGVGRIVRGELPQVIHSG